LLTNNGKEWGGEFGNTCKVYGIQHRFTTLQWSNCNMMAEQTIKTIKHDIIVLFGFKNMKTNGTHNYNECCLDTNVECRPTPSFHLL
jgi:hypothetical protein